MAKHSFVDVCVTHCPKPVGFNKSRQKVWNFHLKTCYIFLDVWSHVTTFA